MKNCLKWEPDRRTLCIVSFFAFVLLMVPLFWIARYAVPWYDDYVYGIFVKRSVAQDPTVFGAVRGAAEAAASKWHTWQGTYSSIFLMAFVPSVWGEEYYFLGCWFLILLLITAVFALVKVLVRDLLHADRETCLILQIFCATLTVFLIHSVRTAFFWYNSGIYYVGMSSVLLFAAAVQIRLLLEGSRKKRILWMLLLTMLCFILGGANYVTALQGLLIMASLICLGALLRNRGTFQLLVPMAVYLTGFGCSIAAPGNHYREQELAALGLGMGPVEAVLQALREGCVQLWAFSGFFTIGMLLLAAPVIWRMVQTCDFSFRYPLLWCGWAFCIYSAGFAPSMYSLGEAGPERTVNAIKITYHILLVMTEGYLLGWLNRRLEKKGKTGLKITGYWWYYTLVLGLMAVSFILTPYKASQYSSYGAWSYLQSGDAGGFYQEYQERLETLNSVERDVVLEPFHYYPRVLSVEDLSSEPSAEPNRAMAAWYDKDSIIVREE